MANYESTHYNITAQFMEGIQGVNTGIVVPWGDSIIPSGFLECNGAAVSRSTYAALFAVVGTAYGSGNGSTTFNVPDLQDKTVLSKSNNKALASTGGANTVSQTGNISGSLANTTLSTAEIAAHLHNSARASVGYGGLGVNCPCYPAVTCASVPANSTSTGGGGAHSHNLSANFSGDANSVLQPYLTLIYIIKT